jgi:DNA primase
MPRGRSAESYDIYPVFKDLGYEVPQVVGERYQKYSCVFHPDRSPSASINQVSFTCHSCGRKGDAISLIREERGVDYFEAVRIASELAPSEGGAVRRKPRRASHLLSAISRD